jgi:hypothetical protein
MSQTAVICKSPSASIVLPWRLEVTLDLQNNQKIGPYQFTEVLEKTYSSNKKLTVTAAICIDIYGTSLNLMDNSPKMAIKRESAMEKTNWHSESSLVFKIAQGIPISFSVIAVTVMSRSSQISLDFAFWHPNISVSSLPSYTLSPSTGSTGVVYLGFGGGTSEYCQSVRIMMSNSVASLWTSDSAIKSKSGQGIGFDLLVSISASGFVASKASLFSFSFPFLRSFSSINQLEVTLIGSGFGLNPSVSRRIENMKHVKHLEPHQEHALIASDVFMQDAIVSSMAVEVEFLNASRLDDIRVILKTRQSEVVLLSSQCFGCARLGNGLTLHFSDDAKSPAPSLLCDESTAYKPLLRSMKSLFLDTGLLQLFVIAGSTPLSITTASVSAELRLVDVTVSEQLASSVVWTSDSSLVVSLPPGAGPNHTVSVQASGQSSNKLGGLSYPLPRVHPSKVSDLASTGMAMIEIVGRFFSYRSATLSIRLAVTSCSGSTWISDVSVICRNAANGGGSLRGIVASVELLHSETSFTGNITNGALFPFAFVASMLKSVTPWMATDTALFTGGMQILVLGDKIGVIDASFRLRIGSSSSRATFWNSDTSTINRVGQRSNGLNLPFRLSANALQTSGKLAPDPPSLSFQILSVIPKNIPRTGSSMLALLGTHFALHSNTGAMRTGQSACELSLWQSDSLMFCKSTSSGFNFRSDIVLTMGQSSLLISVEYLPAVSTSQLDASSNKVPLYSDFGDYLGTTFLISIFGQQFGTSDSKQSIQLDGKICEPSLWISDSSLLCSMSILKFESNRVDVRLMSRETNEVQTFILPNVLVSHTFLYFVGFYCGNATGCRICLCF